MRAYRYFLTVFFSSLLTMPFYGFSQASVYDVVIYGGTAAGFTAAIQVAKLGKKVALLEPGNHIGGIGIDGLGGTDIDNHKNFRNSPAVGGLALEFYKRIAKTYGRSEAFEKALKDHTKDPRLWKFESSVAERIIRNWLLEYKVDLYYGRRLKEGEGAVQKNGSHILAIVAENGGVFKARVFIDATMEGDLLAAAGVTTVTGREANAQYNESFNGIRGVTDHAQFQVKVDPYIIPGNPASGLLPTIQDEPLGIPGSADNHLQAYCFRMCLTNIPENRIPFTKPANYDRSQYEIYLRYEKAGGKLYTPAYDLPNHKTDLGAWHDLSHNLYGMNAAYPGGNYATRKAILDQHRWYTQGLFYFLANDPEVSEPIRNAWSRAGLCKDEFADNEGWPRMFYVRDARRMVSDYVITEQMGRRQHPTPVADPVAVAYWPMDIHSVRRIVRDGYAYNEGAVFREQDWRPFGISYRSLIPKINECTNLLTPSCISSSHIAYGAIRIEFTYMSLGQACGAAASIAIDENKPVQKIRYGKLERCLSNGKQVLDANKLEIQE